jgi:hypothetical protein
MTAEPTIGSLERVPIRKVWADEARDFTPWLAENTNRLSEALGMDLELEGTEIGVGRFSADGEVKVVTPVKNRPRTATGSFRTGSQQESIQVQSPHDIKKPSQR